MISTLKTWKTGRKLVLEYFDKYTLEQLNTTPKGFSNNLIWNIGHIVVAQQSLIYKGAGLNMNIPDSLLDVYKPGTKPTGQTTQAEVDELKELVVAMITITEADYENGIFKTYNERTTGTGFHLASVTDAFEFNNFHEALHLGFMINIRKFV